MARAVSKLLAVAGAVERLKQSYLDWQRAATAQEPHDVLNSRLATEPADLGSGAAVIDRNGADYDIPRGEICRFEQRRAVGKQVSAGTRGALRKQSHWLVALQRLGAVYNLALRPFDVTSTDVDLGILISKPGKYPNTQISLST